MSWTARDHLEELVDRINELLFDASEFRYDELKWQELSHGPELAAAIAFLDTGEAPGPESATTRPNHPTERIMSSKEIIAQAVALLKMIAWLTPIKFDDFAARFLEANQEAAWLIALVERIIPATTPDELEAQSLLYEPELVDALQLFNKKEGKPILGSGKILALILQVLALVKAGKGLIPTS